MSKSMNINDQTKWDLRFLQKAKDISEYSKDPSTQVGCVIVDDRMSVIGEGYNGFPRRIYDDPSLYADREEKYKRILHAEQNALIHRNPLADLSKATLYCYPLFPCNRCALEIIQYEIKRVVAPPIEIGSRWEKDCALSWSLLAQAGVTCHFLDLTEGD